MGFNSAKNTHNVNLSNENYKINGLIFPSRQIFSTIESINIKLNSLYSLSPPNSLWPSINYSSVRDDNEEFEAILDRVEELIDSFKNFEIIETTDAAFNNEFLGIVNFLYEASDYAMKKENDLTKQTPESIKKRFNSIAFKFWIVGVHPSEF